MGIAHTFAEPCTYGWQVPQWACGGVTCKMSLPGVADVTDVARGSMARTKTDRPTWP